MTPAPDRESGASTGLEEIIERAIARVNSEKHGNPLAAARAVGRYVAVAAFEAAAKVPRRYLDQGDWSEAEDALIAVEHDIRALAETKP